MYTALKANFPMERSFFHGNNKTDEDIAFAMDAGVGFFIVDSLFELDAIQAEAEKRGITNTAASCMLMKELGRMTYFSKGSEENLKITTLDDLKIFKALLYMTQDSWIKKG